MLDGGSMARRWKKMVVLIIMEFNSEATADDSCQYPVSVELATNYNSDAIEDDGSCGCSGLVALTINMSDSYGDGWNGNVLTLNGQEFTLDSGSEGSASTCYDVWMY